MISPNVVEENGKYIIRFSFWKVDVYDQPRCWGDFISVLYVFIFFCFGFWLFNSSYFILLLLLLLLLIVDC